MNRPRNVLLVLVSAVALPAADSYLFTSFRDNGEKGVYFAVSRDGYRWKYVNGGAPVLEPKHPGMLMRDPQITQGPDRTWHLVWTTGWNRAHAGASPTIGHASSKDLVHWSGQQLIDIPLEGARNAWAPEMVWDPTAEHWILFWSSTIPGRYPATDASGDDGYNHRIYAMTTSDFKTFSKPDLYFDPGFNCIDATLAKDDSRWILVFKDERKNPLQKKLRLAFANRPFGPFKDVTEPFTGDWVEGPSVLKLGREWLIYFDHYRSPQHYGAYRTRDWKSFTDVTGQIDFPAGAKHGTAIRVSAAEAAALEALH